MTITPIKTKILYPPKDDLLDAIKKSIKKIPEKSILAITSKVVSIWQARCVPLKQFPDKDELIKVQADFYLPRRRIGSQTILHTLTNNILIATAGIDEMAGFYILWPKNVKNTALEILKWLKKTYRVKNVGVLIVDSHSIPLRRGTVGISLAHAGFLALKLYKGKRGIFGGLVGGGTCLNIADSLASASVAVMGEGAEQTPLALISDAPVKFSKLLKGEESKLEVSIDEDLYSPFIKAMQWKKGKRV